MTRRQALRNFYYLLPVILLGLIITQVSFKTDLSAFIVTGNSQEEILLASEMQSGTLSRQYILSIVSDSSSPDKAFIRQLKKQLKTINNVIDVWSADEKQATLDTIQGFYARHASSIYSLSPEAELAKLFSIQGLTDRALFIKKALLSPQGSLVKNILRQDPLLITLNSFKSLSAKYSQANKQPGHAKNLILMTRISGMDAPEQKKIQRYINEQFQQLNNPHQYRLEMTGVPVFAVATQELIQGDVIKISLFSSLALVLLFLLLFRSFTSLFQVFTLLMIVIFSAILITNSLFGFVHGMTIAIGCTLIGICIDYPIHAIVHAQTAKNKNPEQIVLTIWPSMLMGGITTLIGYTALGISGYPGFQQVAVFAGLGIIIALVLTRFVLPGLIKQHHDAFNIPLVKQWAGFCRRYRRTLLIVLLIGFSLSIWQLQKLRWMEDMQQLTPELDYLKANDKRIRSRMISIEPGRFIMVTGADTEQALQHVESVYRQLNKLKQSQALSEYFALYPWILSGKQQLHNQQTLKKHLTARNQHKWRQALEEAGLSVKHLGQFNYTFQPPFTLKQVLETPVKRLIASRIINSSSETIILIWLSEHDPEVLQKAFAHTPHAHYFSQRDMLNTMLKDYTDNAWKLLLSGIGLIFLLLTTRYKSLVKATITLLPAISAAIIILAVWAISGTAVSFLHLVGFLLAVAICVDYGIFYQENRSGNIMLTYQAMAASMLTSALVFGSMIAAESTSLKILATVVSLGVFLGFCLCPVIIQNNQSLCTKKDKKHRANLR